MGNPSPGCAPVRSPLAPRVARHRHSRSISSLPADKLATGHCERRASVSAISSPAKDPPPADVQRWTAATFLIGHRKAKSPHRDFIRRRAPGSGAEDLLQLKRAIGQATAGDRKTSPSFNAFRGQMRVSPASSTKSPSTKFSSRSAPPSENNGAAKIARSVLQPVPTKEQERSGSPPRAATPTETGREAVTPASNMEGERIGCDSGLTMDIDQESPRIFRTSTQPKIVDLANMFENESKADLPSVEDSHSTLQEPPRIFIRRKKTAEIGIQISTCPPDEGGIDHDECIAALIDVDDISVTEEETVHREVIDTGVQCSLSSEEEEEEDEEEEESELEEYYSDASDESLIQVPPSEGDSSDLELVSGVIRKRTRTRNVSASGIGAMLLEVVSVANSPQTVTSPSRRSLERTPFGAEALRARQYVLEKTAQFPTGLHAVEDRSWSPSANFHRACRPEPEDPTIKAANCSKFVDIEVDSGGHCVELARRSTDAHVDDADSLPQSRQTCRQASPGSSPHTSHPFHHRASTNCTTQQRSWQVTPVSTPSPSHLHYRTSGNFMQQQSHYAASGICQSPSRLHYHGSGKTRFSRQATPEQSPSPGSSYLHNYQCPLHQGAPCDPTKDSSRCASPLAAEAYCSGRNPLADPSSRAWINPGSASLSLQECFKTVDSAESGSADKVPSHPNHHRTTVSRLQASPAGAFSRVDVYRPGAAFTVSTLSNPSFSSSHQDRLWEEQTDIYSSGGRGTPGRDEEKPNSIAATNLRAKPVVEDVPWRRRSTSPESRRATQQSMPTSRRGSMSPERRAAVPPKPDRGSAKRRNVTCSSCICFSF